eukprot:11005861-Karenia_brevis.AAC.1
MASPQGNMTIKRHACSAVEQPVAAVLPVLFLPRWPIMSQQVTPGVEGIDFCNPTRRDGRRRRGGSPTEAEELLDPRCCPPGMFLPRWPD